jgi:hypothetical protein
MTVSINHGAYNQRRYSRPWIAKIKDWPVGKSPVLDFGYYNGDDNGGFTEIVAEPGDVIKAGQKDYRNYKYTENDFYLVNLDGSVTKITAAEAKQAWNAAHKEVA